MNGEEFASRWQNLHIQTHHLVGKSDSRNTGISTSEKHADLLRNTVAQLHLARISNLSTDECCSKLFQQYSELYGSVLDGAANQNGLDNFAEVILAQAKCRKNESQQWSSSLSLENVLQQDYIKGLIKGNVDADYVVSTNKQSDFIETSTPQQNSSNFGSWTSNLVQESTHMSSKCSSDILTTGGSSVSESGRQPGFWSLSKQVESLHDQPRAGSSRAQPHSGNKRPPYKSVKRTWETCDDDTPPGGDSPQKPSAFRTAKEQLIIEDQKKNRGGALSAGYGTNKKSLGTRRGLNSKFVPPVIGRDEEGSPYGDSLAKKVTSAVFGGKNKSETADEIVDERLKNLDPKMVEMITNEIMDHGPPITWDDIAGLEFAKKTIKEIVIWPMLRPDIFTGLRGPPKGLLLFGPPGTGKTLIGKCIASQSKSTFFSISASSLTSKWVGEGEKMVRALFGVARVHQPAVIFIDEIDSLLSQRSDGEHEASRRIKTEFLIQLDGATTGADDRILVVGATNRPQEIDEAARRRFVKRLYIPLPEGAARKQIIVNLMSQQSHDLSCDQHEAICVQTDGYSGSDMANLCREAALGPIRDMAMTDIENITADQVRPISYRDFQDALTQVRASVSEKDLGVYLDWNKQFGSWSVPEQS